MVRSLGDAAGRPLLAGIFAASLAVSVFHIFVHDAPLLPELLGQWALFSTTLVFGGVAYYVTRRADTGSERQKVGAYAGSMFGVAGLGSGGYAYHQHLSPVAKLPVEGVVFQALFVALIGGIAGAFVGLEVVRRDRSADQLAALNNLNSTARDVNHALAKQSTRAEVEQVVCDRLAESSSYAFAWIGVRDEDTGEVVPSAAANAQGYLDDVEITVDPDDETGRGPTGTALRTGRPQVVRDVEDADGYAPWVAAARARGFRASAAIPVAYEDTTYGVLNVYTTRSNAFGSEERRVVTQLGEITGLAIAAIDHERELQHERERLEFFNRLVRHNLLNSLNVVAARAELLEGRVDPGVRDHLDTIRERTKEMTDLISTLRTVMKAVTEEGDHELEPVDLGAVVREEVRHARQVFTDAEFAVADDLEDAGAVLADDLLGEVFENLLSNAVQHNDAATPRVTVAVDRERDETTVRIADNGPGVSADLKDRIFEKGAKGFESPGTGFGLHLVREIVDAYGGDVSVRNRDGADRGAEFAVTLPRP